MAEYQYIARTAAGEEVTGRMQADTQAAVVRTLDEQQLYPVEVTEGEEAQAVRRGGRVRPRDVGMMYQQLGDLLTSGVPMLRSLEIIARSGTRGRLSAIVRELYEDVSAGKTLADAMAAHGKVFAELHVAMVRAGEHAGFLEDVLVNLAGFIERQDELRGKVRGALAYPAVLAIVGLAVTLGMLVWLVPMFRTIFEGIAQPLPTRILFAASELLVANKVVLACVAVLGVMGVWGFLRSPVGHGLWERWKLRIPVLGRTIRVVAITRFCRILGTMLANGVPILQALDISKDATGSQVLSDSIEEAAEAVRKGQPLAGPLRASGLFPTEIVEMIAVAEESNQLDRVLVQVADTVERRTNRQVDTAVRLVEPLILVLMAVTIGFIAVSLLYPIFTMAEQIR